ncbi:MAG: hypothetical protein C0490_16740, partial [Marivirga sp.]|nr:hypothetical protein [Marivirga sp.]
PLRAKDHGGLNHWIKIQGYYDFVSTGLGVIYVCNPIMDRASRLDNYISKHPHITKSRKGWHYGNKKDIAWPPASTAIAR